jgi:hypothetical protein
VSHNIDLDRLADYLAGVLDDDDAAGVARLIDLNPAWARAHAALVEADASVRADLRDVGRSQIDPMPAEVVARLDAALARERPPSGDHRGTPAGVTSLDGFRARPAAAVGGSRHRKRRRFAVGLTAAAATVAAVFGGISLIPGVIPSASDTLGARDGGAAQEAEGPDPAAVPASPEPPVTAGGSGGPSFVSSGFDYGPATLDQLARTSAAMGEPPAPAPDSDRSADKVTGVPDLLRGAVAGQLARLTDPAALSVCLASVRGDHPGTAVLVDYARYEGAPALLILVRGSGSSAVVVVGPDCGLAGADETAFAIVS